MPPGKVCARIQAGEGGMTAAKGIDREATGTKTAGAGGGSDEGAPTLVLMDGHALFHRSFHAYPDEMSTKTGEPINAVYGFTRMLLDVLRIIKPDYWAMTFDRPTPTFRHKDYAPYKAPRPSLPDSMLAQVQRVREIVPAFTLPIYELDRFNPNDLLVTLACPATELPVRIGIRPA